MYSEHVCHVHSFNNSIRCYEIILLLDKYFVFIHQCRKVIHFLEKYFVFIHRCSEIVYLLEKIYIIYHQMHSNCSFINRENIAFILHRTL